MRPVNRGNPYSYLRNADGVQEIKPEVESAIKEWEWAEERSVRLRLVITQIKSNVYALTGTNPSNVKLSQGKKGAISLKEIQQLRTKSYIAYQKSVDAYTNNPDLNKAALITAGAKALQAYQRELDCYLAYIGAGKKKVKGIYPTSRGDLIANLGQYCSYCEMPLASSLAVEHMLPKAGFPLQSISWNNFLLACPICNSLKSAKPSRATGTAIAIGAGNNTPTIDQIQTAALTTYIWPSDPFAKYANWESCFAYQMCKVRYNAKGEPITSEIIPNNIVQTWAQGNTRIDVVDDSGFSIEVKFLEWKADVPSNNGQVLEQLNRLEIAQVLKDTITGLQQFQLNFVNPIVITKMSEYSDAWEIKETQSYELDATNGLAPTLSSTHMQSPCKFKLTQSESTEFLTMLYNGALPKQIANFLSDGPFYVNSLYHQVSITKPTRAALYNIEIVKRLVVMSKNVAAGGIHVLGVYLAQQSHVELRLVAIVSGASVQANQVITDLSLNKMIINNDKASDRRMIKRTRAWFSALEAVRSFSAQTAGVADVLRAAEFKDDLRSMIIQTAIATGYWSVWVSVFKQFLGQNEFVMFQGNLSATSNFPGTRG